MKKQLWILSLLFICMLAPVKGVLINDSNAIFEGMLWNEPVYIEGVSNVSFINVTFNGTIMINNSNVVINGSQIYGEVSTVGTVTVDARNNYWNDYAPGNSADGCPDGALSVSSEVQTAPWYRDESLTDSSSNCKPILIDIPDQQTPINALFEYQTTCTDFNNDSLAYTDDTPLFIIGAGTGLISFTPTQQETYSDIEISCSDSEYSDEDTFTLIVGSGYTAQYQGSDMAAITTDFIVGVGATGVSFVGIIALVILVGVIGVYFGWKKIFK